MPDLKTRLVFENGSGHDPRIREIRARVNEGQRDDATTAAPAESLSDRLDVDRIRLLRRTSSTIHHVVHEPGPFVALRKRLANQLDLFGEVLAADCVARREPTQLACRFLLAGGSEHRHGLLDALLLALFHPHLDTVLHALLESDLAARELNGRGDRALHSEQRSDSSQTQQGRRSRTVLREEYGNCSGGQSERSQSSEEPALLTGEASSRGRVGVMHSVSVLLCRHSDKEVLGQWGAG